MLPQQTCLTLLVANQTGEIGRLREEELPVVRVIVPPDPSGRVFEDDLDPGDLVFDGDLTPMLVWHERYRSAAAGDPAGCSAMTPTATGTQTTTSSVSACPMSMSPWRRLASTCAQSATPPLACEIQHRHQHGAFGMKTAPGASRSEGSARTRGHAHPGGQALAGQIKAYRAPADPAPVKRRYHVRLDQQARSPASPDGAPGQRRRWGRGRRAGPERGQQFVILARNSH